MTQEKEERYWYLRSEAEALTEAKTTKQGLESAEAARRLKQDGPNALASEAHFTLLRKLFQQFNNILIYILFGVGVISLLSDHMIEFVVVIVIILFTVFMGFIQEYRAERTIEALAKFTTKKVEIIRDGKKIVVDTEALVRGDIIMLKRGMIVPADIRIIESNALLVDESILTGESVSKQKQSAKLAVQDVPLADRSNMAYSGTAVTGGNGRGVVVETGLHSEIGKISLTLKNLADQRSPLQRKVDSMSRNISFSVLTVVGLFLIVLLVKQFTVYDALILVGAAAVSGIPESFPLVLTLALSNGVKRMAGKNAIVKDLSSVETLGTTTVICTDKTGTLTENRMRVMRLHLPNGAEYAIEGTGYEPRGTFSRNGKVIEQTALRAHDAFFHAAVLCNNEELINEGSEWFVRGDATEGALLALAKSAGVDDAVLRENSPRVLEIPFDPSNKFMVAIHERKVGKKTMQEAYLKGAFERVLEKCTHMRNEKKRRVRLTAAARKRLLKAASGYSADALRVLGVATKQLSSRVQKDAQLSPAQMKRLVAGYTFEGFVGIEDPIRKDVHQAIEECETAGIRVVMITGDHRETAQSIGKRLNLLKHGADKIVLGTELDKMTDEELDACIRSIAIFARATPDHKLRIVTSLQRAGDIVAMTGDGVNDAPALKKADIGVAMGMGGTDVAREASNIVLTDDSFSTIVHAIREGRTIYSNIRRFIYYLLSGNFTEVLLIIATILVGLTTPLTALMILFINLLTSTFPAFALSIEPTKPKVMRQMPRNPKEELLSRYILLKILVIVPVLFVGTFVLFLWELNVNDSTIEEARTVAFAAIILFELLHAFNARSLHTSIFNKHFFSNRYIFGACGTSLVLLLLAIYTPFGQTIFKTVPLDAAQWFAIGATSLVIIIISEVVKLQIRSEFEEQQQLQRIEMHLE